MFRPRKVNFGDFGKDSDDAIFDFLKEGEHEKKYKSTNQIPYLFSSENLLDNKKVEIVDNHNSKNPFFSILEDTEMEDQISNSDGMISETGKESIESDHNSSNKGKLKLTILIIKTLFKLQLSYLKSKGGLERVLN